MENKEISITLPIKELSAAFSLLGGAINPNPIVTACGAIKVVIDSDRICLKSTDLELTIETYLKPVSIDVFGEIKEFCIPYDISNKLLKSFPDAPVEINYFFDQVSDEKGRAISDVHMVQLIVNGQEFYVPSFDAKEFPKSTAKYTNELTLKSDVIKNGIAYVRNCASDNKEHNISIQGVYFHLKDKEIKIIAFNGSNLGVCGADMDSDIDQYLSIPMKSAKFLAENLEIDEDITMLLSDKSISIKSIDWTMTSLLNEEPQVVPYEMLTQIKENLSIELDLSAWKSAIRRAVLMVQSPFVTHSFRDDKCYISSEDNLRNTKSEQFIESGDFSGEFSETLNGKSVLDILSPVSGMVNFTTLVDNRAIVIKPQKFNAKSLIYVTMPIDPARVLN